MVVQVCFPMHLYEKKHLKILFSKTVDALWLNLCIYYWEHLHVCSGYVTQVSEPWPVGLLFLFLHENMYGRYSLEVPHRESKKNIMWVPPFIWSFGNTCTVKPVLVVTSFKQPTCIKQPEESCPKIQRHIYLNCIKQPPAFSSHILSFPWVAA